jgi:hypothetical protein
VPSALPSVEAPVKSAPSAIKHETRSVLEAETSLIATAHARLRSGDGASVLELLKGYEQRFSPPHFEPEVLYLRMQSSLARGDRVEARRLAALIVKRFPASPGVGQAEAILRSDEGAKGE